MNIQTFSTEVSNMFSFSTKKSLESHVFPTDENIWLSQGAMSESREVKCPKGHLMRKATGHGGPGEIQWDSHFSRLKSILSI